MFCGVTTGAAKAADEPPLDSEGRMAWRYVATSRMLETATSGECRPLARSPHSASKDIEVVLAIVPPEGSSWLKEHLSEILPAIDVGNAKEVELFLAGTAPEARDFRCGLLFGMASVVYYQARKEWAVKHGLPLSSWQQP